MSFLKVMFSAVRVSLGFGSLSEQRLSPAHGWLLPLTPAERSTGATLASFGSRG
jgi:hypothetical protein